MNELWIRLLGLLPTRRDWRGRYLALEENLRTALVQRADQQQRPEQEVQAEEVAAGLEHLQTSDWLKQCWVSLSPREQEVAALTCLRFTNRQMAGRMHVSMETIKTQMSKVLDKFDLHSKMELRQALTNWDFRDWGPHQSYLDNGGPYAQP